LNSGYTIHFDCKSYKVVTPKGAPIVPLRSSVEVHKLPDGRLYVDWKGNIYPLEPLNVTSSTKTQTKTEPEVSTAVNEKAGTTPTHRPAQDHPWRKPWKPYRPNYASPTLTKSLTSFT